MDEGTVRFYIAEIAHATDYLHSRRIVHRWVIPNIVRSRSDIKQRSETR